MGAAWSVRRAPALVLLLDGRLYGRLHGPFTEDEIVRSLAVLAAAPREGPWQFLGIAIPLGEARTLAGDPVNLDELPRPLPIRFFDPNCPPCRDALAGLVEATEKILPVVAVLVPQAFAGRDGERLRETGLKVVVDGPGTGAMARRPRQPHVFDGGPGGGDLLGSRRWCRTGGTSTRRPRRLR